MRALVATFAVLVAICVALLVLLVQRRPALKPLRTAPALELDEPAR